MQESALDFPQDCVFLQVQRNMVRACEGRPASAMSVPAQCTSFGCQINSQTSGVAR